MRNLSVESQIYISVIVAASLAALFWMLMQRAPLPPEDQNLVLASAALAVLLELASPSLPYFGSVSTAGALYVFIILVGQPQVAAVVSLLATTLRVIFRDRGFLLLRVFSPFQRLSSVEAASIPVVLFAGTAVSRPNPWILATAAPLYFILDALTEGTAVGFTLSEAEQKRWFRARYRTLALGLALPLAGVAAAFHKNDTVAVSLLFVAIAVLQIVIVSLLQKEILETTSPLIEDLERAREDMQAAERRYNETRQQLQQKTFELGLLLDFGRAIGNNLTLDYSFEVIIDIFKKLFHYQSCIIFFAQSTPNESILIPKRYFTPYGDLCKNLHVPFGESIVGMAAREKHGFVIDARRRHEFSLLIENEKSEMAVPLIVEDRVKGVIYVGHSEPGSYADTDLQLLTTIAYQAAIVLVYAESYEFTVALATTDGLTGLFTHRYFQERLLEEMKRSERYHQPLSLIMLDLDHFKEYNDTYGHPMGDSLLRKVSQILKDCTRESDIVCRYGGDEFVILLIETTKETTLTIAKRIREAIELRINTETRSLVKITTSIGVASFPEDASNKQDLLKKADQALYESKNTGRNRVVAARRTV